MDIGEGLNAMQDGEMPNLVQNIRARVPVAANSSARRQDNFMPISNVIRIMRKVLPMHAKIIDEAKETMQECISKFINTITSEANNHCKGELRKTLTADDILLAMTNLEFDNYVELLRIYLHRYRENEHAIRLGEPLIRPRMAPNPHFYARHPVMFPHQPNLGMLGEGMGGYYDGIYNGSGNRNGGGGEGSGADRASSGQLSMGTLILVLLLISMHPQRIGEGCCVPMKLSC